MTADDIFEDLAGYAVIGVAVLALFFLLQLMCLIVHWTLVCISNLIFRTDFAHPDWEDAKATTFYTLLVIIFATTIWYFTL